MALPLSAAPAQQKSARPPSGVPEVYPPGEIERVLFECANAERAARQLPPVRLSPALSALARRQSEDMARLGFFEHVSAAGKSFTERLEEAGIFFAANGENVARSDSFQAGPIHEALMKSEGHRKNILNPDFDEVGVGVILGGDGVYYVTQDFIRSVPLRDEESVRAVVLGACDEVRRGSGLAPLLIVDEVQRKAQQFALLRSEGKELPPVPGEFGETRVDFYSGPDLGKIAAAIKLSSLERYQITGIGACFGRSPHFSGWAYYVCIFLLAGDSAFLRSEEDRIQAVLRTLNHVRSKQGVGALELDARLSRTARRFGLRYLRNRAGMSIPRGKAVAIVYETPALGRLAPRLIAEVASRDFRRVGISAIPATAGSGLNVDFIVVLLLSD